MPWPRVARQRPGVVQSPLVPLQQVRGRSHQLQGVQRLGGLHWDTCVGTGRGLPEVEEKLSVRT